MLSQAAQCHCMMSRVSQYEVTNKAMSLYDVTCIAVSQYDVTNNAMSLYDVTCGAVSKYDFPNNEVSLCVTCSKVDICMPDLYHVILRVAQHVYRSNATSCVVRISKS